MVNPTFIVLGAQKCGTSWLHSMLMQHPEVYTPKEKELHFFDKRSAYQKGLDYYRQQFDGYAGEKAVGDVESNYLWLPEDEREIEESDQNTDTPELIYKHYPDIKLVIMLRNPVSRAVSAYYHHVHYGRVHPANRLLDVKHQFGIESMGLYARQVRRWLETFPREQILFLVYEDDVAKNKHSTLQKVFRFIGVNDEFCPINIDRAVNKRSNHFYMRMYSEYPLLAKSLRVLLPDAVQESDVWRIPVYANEKAELSTIYRESNEELEQLLERSLPW